MSVLMSAKAPPPTVPTPIAPFRVGDVWTSPPFVVDALDVQEHRRFAMAEALEDVNDVTGVEAPPARASAPAVLVLAHALTSLRRHEALRGAELEALSTGSVAALGQVEVGEPLLAVATVRFLGTMRDATSVTVTVGLEVRRARGGTVMRAEIGLEVRFSDARAGELSYVA
jgi:hypothetical protein